MDTNEIMAAIAAPLDPASIQTKTTTYTDKKTGEVKSFKTRYIDRTTVEERLNEVCPGEWHFQVTPIVTPNGQDGQWVVKGTLTICGVVREDFGMNDNEGAYDPPKAAVSDALKRCASLFGLGRELYHDPAKVGNSKGPSTTAKPKTAPVAPPAPTPAANAKPAASKAATPFPAGDRFLSELDGKEVYAIQENLPAALGIHPKHYARRLKNHYPECNGNIKVLNGLTVAAFIQRMGVASKGEAETAEAEAA